MWGAWIFLLPSEWASRKTHSFTLSMSGVSEGTLNISGKIKVHSGKDMHNSSLTLSGVQHGLPELLPGWMAGALSAWAFLFLNPAFAASETWAKESWIVHGSKPMIWRWTSHPQTAAILVFTSNQFDVQQGTRVFDCALGALAAESMDLVPERLHKDCFSAQGICSV